MIAAAHSLPLPFVASFLAGFLARGAVKSHRAYEAGMRAGIAKVEAWIKSQERRAKRERT